MTVVGSGIGGKAGGVSAGTIQTGLVNGVLESSVVNGVVQIVEYRDRVVEVPVQEARTKHLIHMLAAQMKKYFDKYPKLKD